MNPSVPKSPLWLLLPAVILVLISSCISDADRAACRIDTARGMIAEGRYSAAKLQLDTVDLLYPRCIEQRQQARHLKDTVMLLEAERTLQYNDSLLRQLQPKADSLVALFRYEKNEKYQSRGYYIHPALMSQNNVSGCFLQAEVGDDTQLVIRSFYFGNVELDHTLIRISAGDDYANLTGSNHHFYADGHHEITTCMSEHCAEALRFVAGRVEDKVTVVLGSDNKRHSYTLTAANKKALAQTLELFYALTDIKRLEQTISFANSQIMLAEKRLNENPTRNPK